MLCYLVGLLVPFHISMPRNPADLEAVSGVCGKELPNEGVEVEADVSQRVQESRRAVRRSKTMALGLGGWGSGAMVGVVTVVVVVVV